MIPIQKPSVPGRWPLWLFTGIGLVTLLLTLNAQPSLVRTARGFSWPDYYEAPNQNQRKSLLTGALATPESATRIVVTDVRLETYHVTGETNLVVEAASCVIDTVARVASSDGPIKVQAANGQLLIKGVGFSFRQAEGSITISNQIHTLIRRDAATP